MCLTIIIPSKNRPSLLRRSVQFWAKYDFKVVIVDGSDISQREWINPYLSEKFIYIHKKSSFPIQLGLAAEHITTKYCTLVADDGFLMPSSLKICVDFLEKNQDFVAVNGMGIQFNANKKNISWGLVLSEWLGRRLVDENAGKRMVKHMQNYSNNLTWCVSRSESWCQAAYSYCKYEFPIFAQFELQLNMILAFSGKSISLNNVMYISSTGECKPIRNNAPSLSTSHMIWNFWYEADIVLRQNWLEMMTDTIYHLPHHSMSRGEISSYIEYSIESFCSWSSKIGLAPNLHSYSNSLQIFQNKFWRFILHLYRGLLKKIRIIFYTKRVKNFIRILDNKGILLDENDFASVISSINEHYKANNS